jgi:hypothetical protein
LSKGAPAWAELLQLVPVVTLAISFVVGGNVDLERVAPLFVVAAILTVPIHALVAARGHRANPILLGTAIWLWLGALGFAVPVAPLAAVLGELQATGLFVAAFLVGLVATATSPAGYVGLATDAAWVRKASIGLLALTAVAVGWAFVFRHNVRLGGGLPFILLNVTRRVVLLRFAPKV